MALTDYKILEKINFGTNTEAYRGIHLKENRALVIKKVISLDLEDSSAVSIKNEYNILKYLNSEKFPKVYELERINNEFFLVMEDIEGTSLKEFIQKERLNLATFFTISLQLIEALKEIHSKKVIHKDIKPSNIIVNTKSLKTQIIDFGISSKLSKEDAEWVSANKLEGSIQYISPEQTGRMNRSTDYRSDYYSLGITFYEMLTGRLPFETKDPLELIHAHLAINPIEPCRVEPEIPVTLSNIIMKLISKTPEMRYQTDSGILYDLEKCSLEYKETKKISNFTIASKDISSELRIPQKLYGREKETKILQGNFESFINNSGVSSLQLITGLQGIGKSYLVKEISSFVTQKKGIFLSGKYEQFNRNIPLNAIVQALSGLVKMLLTESAEKIETYKKELLQSLGNNGKVITDIIPELEYIIGEQPEILQLESQENANRFYLTFQNFIGVFAKKENPLVIFLDNMQWADLASSTLIKNLFIDTSINYLYFICSYRTNEVNSLHPFVILHEELQKEGYTIYTTNLQPLELDSIQNMISDILLTESNSVRELSELIYRKTDGNPLFIKELLKQLYQNSSIYFDNSNYQWNWEIEKIKSSSIWGNVTEILTEKIKNLKPETRDILKFASCIGNEFDLYTLSTISNLPYTKIFPILEEATSLELVFPAKENSQINLDLNEGKESSELAKKIIYFFQHDNIQTSNYSLVDDSTKKELRLKIGRLLLANTKAEELEDKLFDIVSHFNTAIELISDKSEKERISELNLMAGKKAKAATTYWNALEFVRNSVHLLDSNSWKEKYQFTYSVYMECVELEYLNRNFEESERLIYLILEKANSAIDKVLAYRLLVISYTMRSMFAEAISALVKALKLVGIDLPDKDYDVALGEELKLIPIHLGDRSIPSLIDAPEMKDPEKIIATQLLSSSLPTAYMFNPTLWCVMMGKTVNLTLQYGNLPETYGYACFGIFQGAAFGDFKKGYEYCELAMKISEKFNSKSNVCKAANVFANHSGSWVRHIKHAEAINKIGFKMGIEVGEVQHASYCTLQMPLNSFFAGKQLNTLVDESLEMLQYARKVNNTLPIHIIIGILISVLLLQGDAKNIDEEIKSITRDNFLNMCNASKDLLSICTYYILNAQVSYIMGDYELALKESQEAEKLLSYITGMHSVAEHNFYYSLSLVANIEKVQGEERQKFLDKILANQKQMKIWADNCSENFLYKYYLVEAEFARIEGRNWEAATLYKKATNEANKNGFIQGQAIANEKNGLFWLSNHEPEIAKLYLTSAFFDFREWGASEKVKKMKELYPDLIRERRRARDANEISDTTSSTYIHSQAIDLQSVLKGATAISSEIQIDRLLDKMIQIVVENVGAQKGIFISAEGDKLLVEAEGMVGKETELKNSTPLEKFTSIPSSIVLYVERTKQYLVIGNATKEEQFKNDNYILQNNILSILCVPLIQKEKLIGIFYLENNLTENAFTADRLQVIRALASQIAISLENAKLYASIEEVTREKTRVNTEMEIAREIQTSLLPSHLELAGYQITAYMKTADEVGGDYYDLIYDDNKVWVVIGDVSGHGVTAGLIMMMVQTAIRSTIHTNPNLPPDEILKKVNDTITENINRMKLNKYMTITLFLIEDNSFYYSGFHQDLVVYRAETGKVDTIPTRGTWLGVADLYNEFFCDLVKINSGDAILLFTDGITESMDPNRKLYDLDGLIKLMNQYGSLSVQDIKEKLLESLAGYKTDDDITFVILKKE